MKRKFLDYLLPIVEEKKYKGTTYYTFKTITWEGKEKYLEGYAEPSLEELQLEMKDFLDRSLLRITSEFLSLWIEECMHIYLKPFEVLGFINGIREICLEAESKPKTKSRVVIENFDINLPNTCMYVGTVNFTFWYWKPKKLIMDLYDLPINDNFVVWVFKEIEKEFSLFLEAYEEERRRVSIPHR